MHHCSASAKCPQSTVEVWALWDDCSLRSAVIPLSELSVFTVARLCKDELTEDEQESERSNQRGKSVVLFPAH